MDCNMVSPLWDWEHLIMPNLSKTESDKKQPSTDWDIEKGEGIDSIFPCFAALDKVSTGTPVSNSSSLKLNETKLASESSLGDFDQVKASTALDLVSVTSTESDLCLKLGKRSYSEDFWGRDNNNNDISAVSVTPSVVAQKKSKSSCRQSIQVPRCQIDGCELDLSSAKDYHRKHRVCENHSKCPVVTVGGIELRFCQQCSRLHAISEFDEKKRSCRKRLSHHNARRRKPQGVFHLNPDRVYNPRQHTNMFWNGLSLNTRSEEKYAWGTTYETTKPTQMESGFTLNFQRSSGAEEQVFGSSNLSFSAYQTSGGFSAGKSNFQLPGKGVGEYSGSLHDNNALSLLSTSSDSHGTKHHPMVESQPIHGTFSTHFI